MATRSVCALTFTTTLGKKRVIRINNPRPTLSTGNVNAASTFIKAANMFDDSIGNMVDLVKAEVISETTNTIL